MSKLIKIAFFLMCLVFCNLHQQSFADETEDRLVEAQKKLEEATREYAELSAELGGDKAKHFIQSFAFTKDGASENKARLGINIGETTVITDQDGKRTFKKGRADGVNVLGVSPDGPAEKVGLQAGDVITSLNGQVLLDDGDKTAIKQLTDIMSEFKPGDAVDLMYQRDGVTQSATVITDEMPKTSFKMMFGDKGLNFDGLGDINIDIQGLEELKHLDALKDLEGLQALEGLGDAFSDSNFIFISKSPLGDAELTELSPELGEYFGAESGLLVVKAPSDESIDLRDGDVIRSIDGREPKSVSHAMRIMRSYDTGEEVTLKILRKKRKRDLNITIPEASNNKSHSFKWSSGHQLDEDMPLKLKKRVKVTSGQEST